MQPCPRRIRAVRGGATVIDSVRAFYVWEVPHYPAYYLPVDDVDPSVFALPKTESFESGPFAGLVHVDWHAVDAWFEEDEEVFGGHPRSPYARVDAIRSSRHIRVEIEGVVLAETTAPVLLFETGLPTRHYIQRTDVELRRARAHRHRDLLPLQGDDQRLLVGADRRRRCTPTSPGPTPTPRPRCCRSPGWSPSTTRRSTPSTTASRWRGRGPNSPAADEEDES